MLESAPVRSQLGGVWFARQGGASDDMTALEIYEPNEIRQRPTLAGEIIYIR
jgi:hypothetical protein